ncbi:uncharacterized protein LOC132804120 [Ziziphus jujuba]|uniref:non-specific serine/threonine protein kinase n=1 Tax=Ziziphus jujuba TaxID=326968 RepID=A0ABM4ABH3_ZIZJJ|nr:uncharacterized protein LOC132804120 [Ziziphus jujuba]
MDTCAENGLTTTDDDRAASTEMARPNPASKSHKRRGPTRMEHIMMDEPPQYNEFGVAINRAAVHMNNLEGSLVRSTIPISIRQWRDTLEDLKNSIWEEIKKSSNKDENLKKQTLIDCAVKWRRFKSCMYLNYVKLYLGMPEVSKHRPQVYDFITQDVWDEFVSQRLTDDYQEISKKISERRQLNKDPHRVGALGYARLEVLMDGLRNQANKREIESSPPDDILTQALGTEETEEDSLFINCGGEEIDQYDSDNETSQAFISPKGNWAYSNSGGFLSTFLNSSEYIKREKCAIPVADAPLYAKARLSPASLKYSGFCLRKGRYNVTLHFAEIVFAEDEDYSSSMKRIFNVYIQGERVLTDFNIKDSAGGPKKIIAKNFTANVTDNDLLEIHLYWAGKGSSTDTTPFNGPLISAITTLEIKGKKLSPLQKALIALASIVFAALLLLALAWAMGWFGKEELHGQEKPVTLKQLKDVTGKFSKEMEIGKGSSGTVYRGRLCEMVDKNLLGYDEKEAMTILKLPVRCINISTSFRPTLSEVVSVLIGEKTIDDIWKPDSTQNLCQNCLKSLREDDSVVEHPRA